MGNAKESGGSSLLWDCFTNWSQTLEKLQQMAASDKQPRAQQ